MPSYTQNLDSRQIVRVTDSGQNTNLASTGRTDFDQSDYVEITGNGARRQVELEAKNDGQTDPVALYVGGVPWRVKRVTIECNGAGAYTVLTLPAPGQVVAARANADTAITATTATAFAIGNASSASKYGESSGLAKNAKITNLEAWSPLTSDEAIFLIATNGAGVPTGTLNTGSITVEIAYISLDDLPDAA